MVVTTPGVLRCLTDSLPLFWEMDTGMYQAVSMSPGPGPWGALESRCL